MTVFLLFSDAHRATEVDLFLEPSIDYGGAYERVIRQEVATRVEAVFCSLEDLIVLKPRRAVRVIKRISKTFGGCESESMTERLPHDADTPNERVWEKGWEEHKQRQRERLARLPLPEKLAWLEETHRLLQQ